MNLEIKLQEILDEKVKVLGDLERIIYSERYSLSEDHKRILSLQSINMMYSVWEGFITASLKEYINYINSKFSDISSGGFINCFTSVTMLYAIILSVSSEMSENLLFI